MLDIQTLLLGRPEDRYAPTLAMRVVEVAVFPLLRELGVRAHPLYLGGVPLRMSHSQAERVTKVETEEREGGRSESEPSQVEALGLA
jgi:hypothetical protein